MNIVQKSKERYLEYERRHQHILDAAIRIFNTKGYRAATTAEIAQEAGISEPTMYKHFPSKKDLFLICSRSIQDQLMDAYREIYRQYREDQDEIRYIEGVTRAYLAFVQDNPHKSMFLVHLLSYKEDPDFETQIRGFIRESVTGVERILESARRKSRIRSPIDSYSLASIFVNQYFTVVALKEFMEPGCLTEDLLIQFVHGFLGIDGE